VGAVTFAIRDINSINNIVIPHFTDYPLRGTKYLDYLAFKKVVGLINSNKHYTKEGLDEIIKISHNMNTFIKFTVEYSPNHAIESNSKYMPINGHYINGFIAGDGCLAFNTKDVNFGRMSWQISQHNNNKLLLLSIADYFKSSNKVYYHDINSLKSLWVALNYEKILFWIILENILYMVLKLLD